MRAKIIAFANRKGGVGKTTSVSSLGGVAASRRKKVLFVDMDSQANLTGNFLAETPEHTIVDMFGDRKRRLPVMRIRENLFLVPGDCDIAGLESALSTAEDRLILSAALEKVREEYIAQIPLKRGGTTDEVAKVALFLASDLSSYVSGQVIPVNGALYC